VTLYDTVESQLITAIADITTKLTLLETNNLLFPNQTSTELLSRITTSPTLDNAIQDAIYIQECVPEVLEFKRTVYQSLEDKLNPNVIIGSSTSGILPSKLAEGLKNRDKILVAHPINPPHLMPLVEIVPSPWTNPELVVKAKMMIERLGCKPIVLKKEVMGFVQNRLQYAILGEAMRMVEQDLVSPEDVDKAVVYGLAPRWAFMGPFQTIDLNAPKGVSDYCDRYLEGIGKVLLTEDNSMRISNETVSKIDGHQRSLYPVDDVPKFQRWRDERLVALMRHFGEQKAVDDSYFNSNN